MVSSAHPLATQAGIDVLKRGGNAIDATVAVSFSLAVVYPRAGNLGGGGFLVFRAADGQVNTLDFRERAPSSAFRNMYLDSMGNVKTDASLVGGLAIGVPGSVAGLFEAHKTYGNLPWEELLFSAIKYAQKGFRITQQEANRLNHFATIFKQVNGTTETPFVKRCRWRKGNLLRQPQLAHTLTQIARHGQEYFYQGEHAASLANFIQSNNGIITTEDLNEYRALWRSPQTIQYKEYTLHCMPLPSSGGVALGQMLNMVENFDLTSFHSVRDVHLMSEIERRAYADRAVHLGDPDYVDVPLDQILDQEYLNQRMKDFNPDSASNSQNISSGSYNVDLESFETTHFSIVDKYGHSAALTTTLNSNYGCKLFFPEGGYFLNNEMDDFSAKPGVPNQFGLVGNSANSIAPGKRMLSSMTPTIVEKDGDFFLALGTPGGSTIITSVFQVFLNMVEYGLPLDEAIQSPRFHHQWLPDLIFHEPDFPESTLNQLVKMGHHVTQKNYIGMVDAVYKNEDGHYEGGADRRGDDDCQGL